LAILFILSTQEGFQSSLNSFMSTNFGVKDAYQTVIANAKAAGMNANLGFDMNATIMVVPSAWLIVLSSMWGAGNAGEIRDKGTFRTKLGQIAGSLALCTAMGMVFGYFIISRFGSEFMSSASYLFYTAPAQYPLPIAPFFSFFASMLSGNWLVIILVWLAFFSWWWMANPNAGVYGTRVILAMGMDRAIPSWFGKVNGRTHTALNAMIVVGLVAVVFDVLYAYTGFAVMTAALGLLVGISYAIVCFGGAIWPWLKPETYKASPIAKYKIAGIPAVTISGILFLLFFVYILEQFLTNASLGVAGSVPGYLFAGGFFVLGAILYAVMRIYRKSKESLDLGLVFKEIPPE
jgi:basic amino acid/polyamine antiporter, APA family